MRNLTNRRKDGRKVGRKDGRKDERKDGQKDGQTLFYRNFPAKSGCPITNYFLINLLFKRCHLFRFFLKILYLVAIVNAKWFIPIAIFVDHIENLVLI